MKQDILTLNGVFALNVQKNSLKKNLEKLKRFINGSCHDEIISKVRKTIELLKNNNISIKEAYLFGSYASGSEHEWSAFHV